MNKEIYNSRVLQFADFLDGQQDEKKILADIKLYQSQWQGDAIEVTVWISVFKFLPEVFDSWFYECVHGDPVLDEEEFITTIESVFRFFSIKSIEEFCELFAIGCQNRNGWNILKEGSDLKELAHNLVCFVKERELNEKI